MAQKLSFARMVPALLAFFALAGFAHAQSALQRQVLVPTVQLGEFCSGSVIFSETVGEAVETYILTAKHCVKSGEEIPIRMPAYDDRLTVVGFNVQISVVERMYHREDLAVLKLKNRADRFPVVRLAPVDTPLALGDDVVVAGFPRGGALTLTRGTFGGRESIPFPNRNKMTEYFRATAQVAGGNSGGILARQNQDGVWEQIGVVSAAVPTSDFMAYHVPLDQIHDFLKLVKMGDKKTVISAIEGE